MIRFENVSKQYRGTPRPALDNVDFEVVRGEFVFLVGASGSGKSSCLRLMLKEDTPTSGNVLVLGRNLRSLSNRKVPTSVATSARCSKTSACCPRRTCSPTSRSRSR